MCIHNRLYALIFRIVFLVGCGMGLYLNSGLPSGKPAPYMLIFYTIQSNVLCFLFFFLPAAEDLAGHQGQGNKGCDCVSSPFQGRGDIGGGRYLFSLSLHSCTQVCQRLRPYLHSFELAKHTGALFRSHCNCGGLAVI